MEDWGEFSEEGEALEGETYEEQLRLTEGADGSVAVTHHNSEDKDYSFARGLVSLRPTDTENGVKLLVKQLEDAYCFKVQFGAIDKKRIGVFVPEGYSKIRQEWIKETLDYYTPASLKIDMVEADYCCAGYFELQWGITDDLTKLLKSQRGDKIPYTEKGFDMLRDSMESTLQRFVDEGLIEGTTKDIHSITELGEDHYNITVHGKGAVTEVQITGEIKL
jgi:hypothetical protein